MQIDVNNFFFSPSGSGDKHEKQSLNKQLDSCFCESLYIPKEEEESLLVQINKPRELQSQ